MTTRRLYALFHRIDVRAWLVAAALGCFFLSAHAANSGNIGRANITGNGNSVSVTQATVNSGGSTIPVSPSIGGWTQAGNYGVPPTASGTTMNRTINGETVISGVRYPFQAGYQNPWSGLVGPALTAVGVVASGGCSLISSGMMTLACATAVQTALPYIYQWITSSGGRFNPDTGQLERVPDGCYTAPCYSYTAAPMTSGVWVRDGVPACMAWFAAEAVAVPQGAPFTFTSWTESTATCLGKNKNGTQTGTIMSRRSEAPLSPTWMPSSMDDIAPYMQAKTPPSGNVVGEILGPGQGSIPDVIPTVTGPASVAGPVSTTVNPDGTKTSSQTTYNFNTAGNTITNTINNTVTNNYNSSNQVTSTTTKTDTPVSSSTGTGVAATQNSDPPPTQCDKYPDSLGCATADVPAGTIPRDTKTLTWSEESVFGGGSCPADRSFSSIELGRSVKVVDWTTFCANALPIRAMVILLATFAAFLIVLPGKEVRT